MSATDLMLQYHQSYTDSIRLFPGIDCTDNNTDNKPSNNNNTPQSNNSGSRNGAIKDSNSNSQQVMMSSSGNSGPQQETASTSSSSARSPQQMDLNREEVRLRTFDNEAWNVPFLNKAKLAQIGFYYIGPEDTVRCHFCRVEIGKWEPDDDCFTEHSRWSSTCPLLRRDQTENVPIDAEALNQILPPITYDTCGGGVLIRTDAYAERSFTPSAENEQSSQESGGEESSSGPSPPMMHFNGFAASQSLPQPPYVQSLSMAMSPAMANINSTPPPLDNSGVQGSLLAGAAAMPQMFGLGQMSPANSFYNPVTTPHLEIEANRLKTFKEWPIQLRMKPSELSDAGFFYTGVGDRVQCFSCGGGLKNWENDDVAWEQHALWYSNCEYMKLIKGQQYIDAVQTVHRQRSRAEAVEAEEELEDPDEDVESSEEEASSAGEDVLPAMRVRAVRGVTSEDTNTTTQNPPTSGVQARAGPSSSSSSSVRAEIRRGSRRRQGANSHPEADLESAEAILAAKSAKPSEVPETKLCKICYEAEFNTAFIPCGHVVACAKCASAVTTCPMCRKPFDSVTRIYFS